MNPLLRPSRTCSAEATAIQFLLMACPGKKAHAIAIKIATQRYSRNPISAQFLEAIARRAQTTDRQCQEASFVPRDRKFESISLQWRVGEPSVPQRGTFFLRTPCAHHTGDR